MSETPDHGELRRKAEHAIAGCRFRIKSGALEGGPSRDMADLCDAADALLSHNEALSQEVERLRAEVENSREDEYRDALSDLVSLHSEFWAIGGGRGFKERHAKAWDTASELVRVEP